MRKRVYHLSFLVFPSFFVDYLLYCFLFVGKTSFGHSWREDMGLWQVPAGAASKGGRDVRKPVTLLEPLGERMETLACGAGCLLWQVLLPGAQCPTRWLSGPWSIPCLGSGDRIPIRPRCRQDHLGHLLSVVLEAERLGRLSSSLGRSCELSWR